MTRLERLIDKKLVEWVLSATPDELAPQLGKIVKELLDDEDKHLRERGIPFVKATVLTDNFKSILSEVFKAIGGNKVFSTWLNLDMGSGKTHLLALITYVLYAYDLLDSSGALDEYKELGLTSDVAKTSALLVIDLRTPSEFHRTYLRFFAKHLRNIGEKDAAFYIEKCIETRKIPDAQELVDKLRRARPVILIDELHHAVLTYRSVEKEREMIERVLAFVLQLVNYLGHNGRGFVLLVASARRDYERLLQLSGMEEDSLMSQANNFISQVVRVKHIVETTWLSVSEAKKIVLKKLGAKHDVIHPLFDRFIERVVKAESDIPQAQHLRSLIKAFAAYAKKSIELGHNVISPTAFSEAVIDALFPEGGGIADRYKSVYSTVIREIELASMDENIKDAVKLATNAVFTMSISGRAEQLIETIKAKKFGQYSPESLPAISGKEIEKILYDLGFKYHVIGKAVEILSSLPYIHYVKVGHDYLYFVVPVESVVSVFRRYIDERFKHYVTNREQLIDKFIQWLYIISGEIEGSYVKVVGGFNELEEVTKRLDPDKMYIVIYAEPELVKHLDEAIRKGADVNTEIRKWFDERSLRNPAEWLAEHGKPNIAIVVPTPSEEVLRNMAMYSAIEDALVKIARDYLVEYQKDSRKLPDEVKKVIEIELDEIHRALNYEFQNAIDRVRDAFAKGLSYVYVYECSVIERNYSCLSSLRNVAVEEVGPSKRFSIPTEYSKLVEILHRHRDSTLKDVVNQLVKRVKTLANFVDEISEAQRIIETYIESSLREHEEVEIRSDMNRMQFANKIFYIPPSKLLKATVGINENKLEERLKAKVEKIIKENYVVFKVARKAEERDKQPENTTTPQKDDPIAKALEDMNKFEHGIVELIIEFDKENRGVVRTMINAMKRYVKKIDVKPHGYGA